MSTKEDLKVAIRYAMANMERDAVAEASSSFVSRLKKVLNVNDGHIV